MAKTSTVTLDAASGGELISLTPIINHIIIVYYYIIYYYECMFNLFCVWDLNRQQNLFRLQDSFPVTWEEIAVHLNHTCSSCNKHKNLKVIWLLRGHVVNCMLTVHFKALWHVKNLSLLTIKITTCP